MEALREMTRAAADVANAPPPGNARGGPVEQPAVEWLMCQLVGIAASVFVRDGAVAARHTSTVAQLLQLPSLAGILTATVLPVMTGSVHGILGIGMVRFHRTGTELPLHRKLPLYRPQVPR